MYMTFSSALLVSVALGTTATTMPTNRRTARGPRWSGGWGGHARFDGEQRRSSEPFAGSEWVKFDRIDYAARVARSVLATLIKTSPSIFLPGRKGVVQGQGGGTSGVKCCRKSRNGNVSSATRFRPLWSRKQIEGSSLPSPRFGNSQAQGNLRLPLTCTYHGCHRVFGTRFPHQVSRMTGRSVAFWSYRFAASYRFCCCVRRSLALQVIARVIHGYK